MPEFLPAGFAKWRRTRDGFDPRSYFLENPDVRIYSNAQQLHQHWTRHGQHEERLGSGISPYAKRRPWKGDLSKAALKVAYYGPVSAFSGLGCAARGYVAALSVLNIELEVIDTTASLYPEPQRSVPTPSKAPDVIVLHQNPDSFGNLFRLLDRKLLDGVYTIGIWVWEVMAFRSEWIETFCAVDEVWTPSKFVTEAIEAAAPSGIPIRTIPHVVEAPSSVCDFQRSDFGIPEDAFAFLSVFDASSAFERKNPLAVLEAFDEAFGSDPAAFLVMKFHSGDAEAAKVAMMRRRYSASNVMFLDDLMRPERSAALKRLSDCLVSAHCSEGFGLNIAEAMAAGKPVIVTKYSGNLTFCDETNSLLVPARLCEVKEGTRHYPAGSVWAAPDHRSLVSAMRCVVADEGRARERGQRAAETIERDLDRERIAALIAAALREIKGRKKQVHKGWEHRRRLAWRHPGALGSPEFALGKWPTFSLMLRVHDDRAGVMEKLIKSILAQTYPYWELCICDDGSTDAQTLKYLKALRGGDQRIRLRRISESKDSSIALSAAVEVATGDFLTFVDLTRPLARNALATYANAVAENPDCTLLYRAKNERAGLEMHMLTVRKYLFLEVGAFAPEDTGARLQDLAARMASGHANVVRVHVS